MTFKKLEHTVIGNEYATVEGNHLVEVSSIHQTFEEPIKEITSSASITVLWLQFLDSEWCENVHVQRYIHEEL